MKKALAIILAIILGISVLAACGGLEDPPPLPAPRVRDANKSPVTDPAPPIPIPLPDDPAPVNPDGSGSSIPGSGGTFIVDPPTEFTFIPDQSGVWEFFTSDNEGDPYLELFGGEYNGLIHEDDDSAGDSNALIRWILNAGDEYTILARNWGSSDTGSFTLNVRQINPVAIPGGGGSVQVDGESYFIFIPDESGMWEFLTSDNGESDPRLAIYDENGVELYDDDDSGGGMNAKINARLEAGTAYYVRGFFWFWDDESRFVINVTQP